MYTYTHTHTLTHAVTYGYSRYQLPARWPQVPAGHCCPLVSASCND